MTNKKLYNEILIVDDTPQNIQVLGKILEENAYQITIAQNGIQALKSVEQSLPDLILLDIMMPELDGFETCKRLKENPITKDIPVIFLTAKIETHDVVKGFEIGAVDYIVKPFNPAELLRRVKTHLELKEKSDNLELSNQNYRELIHVLCHDLANPINFMMTVLDLAKNDISIFKKMKDHMISTVANAGDIIDLVRKMQALEEGKYSLNLEDINLKQILDESIVPLKQKLSKKNLELIIQVDDHLYVNVERTSFLNSVISNIITNAIKFSFPDSKIMINSQINENRVTISIRDFGMGMPESLLHNIFNVNKPTSREGTVGETGTGFGMPLVQKFIVAYGGAIEISSKEKINSSSDHGTEVKLTLKGASE